MSALPQPLVAPLSPALRSFEVQWRSREPDALAALREHAMQRVLRLGLPTTRDETWRYTNLRHLLSTHFSDASATAPAVLQPDVSLLGADEPDAIILVNGHPTGFSPGFSASGAAIDLRYDGIEINSLRDEARQNSALIASHFEPLSDADQARWGLLNTALFQDGLYVKITGQVATPLVIRHVLVGEANRVAYPRVVIETTPGARATIIEHYVDHGEAVPGDKVGQAPLCNSATHIAVGRGSRVEHTRVFATSGAVTHIDSLTLRQDADSHCKQFTFALGGGVVRTTLEADLRQPGASLDSYSLLVGHESRHVDCVNIVTHNARDTRSRQTARAIASGTSRVVFDTKVVVNAGAVHADSRQSCRGLLLSPTAEIDTRPQLEIHADEVKCAHGATVGRLDPDMLFYMLSRGVDRETAQSLLVYAFLADVLTHMSVASAREIIETALIAQLPDAHVLQNFR